ncbi:hypothetical protein PTKU46_35390 [Paraburkholderia terrae]
MHDGQPVAIDFGGPRDEIDWRQRNMIGLAAGESRFEHMRHGCVSSEARGPVDSVVFWQWIPGSKHGDARIVDAQYTCKSIA